MHAAQDRSAVLVNAECRFNFLRNWTVDDFLAWEAQQPERYEFIDGMVFMMVGGSAAHAIIKDNVTAAPCDPASRIRPAASSAKA